MPQNRRERLHDAAREEIKTTARQLMAEEGTAAISIRAIARRMGITAPGLYRYYKNRDAIITALIVDAYTALGDALDTVLQSFPAGQYAHQFIAVAEEYRRWALAHPVDYALIFGNPIPGYQAPPEVTSPAAQRALSPFGAIVQAAWEAGELHPRLPDAPIDEELHCQLAAWTDRSGYTFPPHITQSFLRGWGQVQGLTTLELYGHLQHLLDAPGRLFRAETEAYVRQLGFVMEQVVR
ncbi:MAG: TetR/AcrR family transcriptional regulator [Chloroflexaceae bacterium]|nr:TetR/AcrR family transcriptional regulator [Chloroflexaceae bacterium]NJL33751.1 TetR/AcrR family transcriptional regulator [Chloroflexaceae bacterium]NJO04401.1 TetR/AcrR family transcriptional regulator [Chloroflexaceae bacterium]